MNLQFSYAQLLHNKGYCCYDSKERQNDYVVVYDKIEQLPD